MERKINTLNDYINLIRQALDDVEELRAAVEYDGEFMGDSLPFLDPIEENLKELLQLIDEGAYQFSDYDLPFMERIASLDTRVLPIKPMLLWINEAHRQGLP